MMTFAKIDHQKLDICRSVACLTDSEVDSEEQADTVYDHEVLGMSVKCSHKDIVFLGDGQDSNEHVIFIGKLLQHKDQSSNDIECTDQFTNLVGE